MDLYGDTNCYMDMNTLRYIDLSQPTLVHVLEILNRTTSQEKTKDCYGAGRHPTGQDGGDAVRP